MSEVQQRPNIRLTPVTSSQIAAIGHDAASNTLAIQFLKQGQPGSVYHYSNVTPEQFAEFRDAESIGSHFGKNIRGQFDFVRVEEPKEEKEGA